LEILRDHLIPWSQDDLEKRLLVVRSQMEALPLPESVCYKKCRRRGKRRIVKNLRRYGNSRMVLARWPEEALIEIAAPKLFCVVRGCADLRFDDFQLSCAAGSFLIIPPLLAHPDGSRAHLEGKNRESGSCDLLQVIPVPHGIHLWVCRSTGTIHDHVPTTNCFLRNDRVRQLFLFLAEEAMAPEAHSKPICAQLLATFLLLVQRDLQAGRYLTPHSNTPPEVHTQTPDEALTDLDTYLREHLNEPLTIESVARQMHLSRAQFARRIREQTGKTFVEHLNTHRLREACLLLAESEWTAAAISEFVGFKSPDSFQRWFRLKAGMTPIAYRKQSRSKSPKGK
jgi:AraC-like DNA-binding protein